MIRRVIVSCMICATLVLSMQALPLQYPIPYEDTNAGPYLDRLLYLIIVPDDQQVLALQNDEIDLIGDYLDPVFYPQLEEANNIEVEKTLQNGYGTFIINCDKYPFNITAFRKAIALGMNKSYVAESIWGENAFPQDSILPIQNPYSSEGSTSVCYYEPDLLLANSTLDDAGFLDIDHDGFREAPDGSEIDIEIESIGGGNAAWDTCWQLANTLDALGFIYGGFHDNFGWTEALTKLIEHEDYDIIFTEIGYPDLDASWIGEEFSSSNMGRDNLNLANFINDSCDLYCDTLLHSMDPSEIVDATTAIQEIVLSECPYIPCYQRYFASAYRTDRFEGFQNDFVDGASGWWTNQKVYLKLDMGGPFGGELRRSLPLSPDTFNILSTSSEYTMDVLGMLYDSLFKQETDGTMVNWLTRDYLVETHEDDVNIPEGHTRLTFDIIYWAKWSDGESLDANDIAFTLTYYRNDINLKYSEGLDDLISATAPTPYKLVVEFSTESMWHLQKIAYKPILPHHTFSDPSFGDWSSWNPQPPSDAMVTSGHFNISEVVAGDYIEFTRAFEYMYRLENRPVMIHSPDDANAPPENVTYIHGETGNEISWFVDGRYPSLYEIHNDSHILEDGYFYGTGTQFTLNVDNHNLGTYKYTLTVTDHLGQSINHTIQVEVITQEEAFAREILSALPLILMLSSAVAASVLVSVYVLKWRSRNV